jgi:hypothetical protein
MPAKSLSKYWSTTVPDLRQDLEARGADTSGLKPILIERLMALDAQAAATNPAAAKDPDAPKEQAQINAERVKEQALQAERLAQERADREARERKMQQEIASSLVATVEAAAAQAAPADDSGASRHANSSLYLAAAFE